MLFNNRSKILIIVFAVFVILCFFHTPIAHCQYWTVLPPYNTLWPLWSQALSPINAVTGLPTPMVSSLTSGTILPVQPGLTWNPALSYPWFLYNTPLGMVYYDFMFGINTWPPFGYIDAMTGAPIPITLPENYGALPPTSSSWILSNLPAANNLYQAAYPYYAYLATLPLTTPLFLPSVTPLNITQKLTMLPVLGLSPIVIPPVLSAAALL